MRNHLTAVDQRLKAEGIKPEVDEPLQRGEQIAYVPTHALRWAGTGGAMWAIDFHPDVEFGFVTSQRGSTVFCRYWRKGHPGELRTVANSEGAPADCLVRHKSVSDALIAETLARIETETTR